MKYPLSELLDRISIFKLKVDRIKVGNREFEFLLSATESYNFPETDVYIIQFLHINSQIWDLEFDIRNYKEDVMGLREIGERAVKIRNLNDLRCSLKREIDQKCPWIT